MDSFRLMATLDWTKTQALLRDLKAAFVKSLLSMIPQKKNNELKVKYTVPEIMPSDEPQELQSEIKSLEIVHIPSKEIDIMKNNHKISEVSDESTSSAYQAVNRRDLDLFGYKGRIMIFMLISRQPSVIKCVLDTDWPHDLWQLGQIQSLSIIESLWKFLLNVPETLSAL